MENNIVTRIQKIEGNTMEYSGILRRGLPQGLSMSPLLAVLVLETLKLRKLKLKMYADDGIFLLNDAEDAATADE
jgi:hypothetical protein